MRDVSKSHKTPTDISSFFIGSLPGAESRIFPKRQLVGIRQRLQRCLLVNAGVSVLAVVLTFWENNEYHVLRNPGERLIVALRTLLTVITGLQLVLVLHTYRLYTCELRAKGDYCTSLSAWCTLEFSLTCIVSLPFYDFSTEVNQLGTHMDLTLDDILVPLTCLRLLHVFKCVQYLTFLSRPRTDFYLALHSVLSRTAFLVKGLIASGLVKALAIAMAANMLLGGLLLRVFERALVESRQMDFVWNGFWLAEVSDHTIGYGDLVPKTHIGRAIIVLCIFAGIWSLAFVVVWVNEQLAFSDWQLRLYATLLARVQAQAKLHVKAILLIQRFWRLQKKRKRAEQRLWETFSFNSELQKFRFERSLCKAVNEPTLKDQMYYFESDTIPAFRAALKPLSAVRDYEDTVSCT